MTETPYSLKSPRVQFSLAGPSRPYDPARQAIRADLADAAEAEHHFSPHYALPSMWVSVCETALRDSNSSDAAIRATLPKAAQFALLDLTGDWGWGYAIQGHIVGYVARCDLAPAAIEMPAEG